MEHPLKKSAFCFAALLLLTTAATVPAKLQETPGSDRQPVNIPFGDAKWQAIVPELGNDSPQIAILRVDGKTGATQLLIRIPKMMHVPLHWHSANETHTVIQGDWVFEHDGSRHRLGPGGFNYIPAKTHHQAWASDNALVFITVDSAWDVNWVEGPPGKPDLGKSAPEVSKR
jgi:quercetin dioxygenase-like cupin family protein